jgi:hypothetical protein
MQPGLLGAAECNVLDTLGHVLKSGPNALLTGGLSKLSQYGDGRDLSWFDADLVARTWEGYVASRVDVWWATWALVLQ